MLLIYATWCWSPTDRGLRCQTFRELRNFLLDRLARLLGPENVRGEGAGREREGEEGAGSGREPMFRRGSGE